MTELGLAILLVGVLVLVDPDRLQSVTARLREWFERLST
jgi:hypothetical protein